MYHPPSLSGVDIAQETHNRPRNQPPKKVWMDAIINKSRSTEPSPSNSSGMGPPHTRPHAHGFVAPPKHTRMLVTADDGTTWHPLDQAPPPPLPPPMVDMRPVYRSSRSPPPVVTATALQALSVEASAVAESRYAEQFSMEHSALETVILKALKDMVADQDCCFIARGECHLCTGTNLVPVVNFCPDFSPTHSLCREHLRSMHRVRLEDIFAGKNQPTVSKRALRCTVCALSCPCSKCQLARDSEIAKYKQWLGSPGHSSVVVDEPAPDRPGSTRSSDSEMDQNGRSAARPRSRERTPPPPPLQPSSAMPKDDSRHGDDAWNGNGASRRHQDGSRRSASVESAGAEFSPGYAEDKYDALDPRGYNAEEKPVDGDNAFGYGYGSAVEAPSGLPPMPLRADEKKPVRVNRMPKRAAKESVPYPLDTSVGGGYASRGPTPRDRLLGGGPDVTPAMASPTAASVLNCPDSEKSLVDLLSSLNQQITPAVRFFADEEEPPIEEAAPSSSSRVDDIESSGPSRRNGREESAEESFDGPDSGVRRQKRKREGAPAKLMNSAPSSSRGDGKDDSTSEKGSVEGENGGSTYRQKAPTPLTTSEKKAKPQQPAVPAKPPSPSPRGRPSSRPKHVAPPPPEPKTSSRKREAPSDPIPTPPGSTRRRKTEAAPVARAQSPASERKTGRGPDHRRHAHKSAKARQTPRDEGRGRKKKAKRADEDSDEDVRYIPGEDEDDEDLVEEGGEGEEEEEDDELDTNLDYCEVCLAAGDLVCCDICPRSFHLKCLKMTEDDLPEGDWQCAECKKPSYFESFTVSVAEKTTVPAKCLQIVQCLKSHPFAKQFLLPVENVPHYTAIVKQPMDLTTIEKKILDGKYMVNGKGTLQGGGGASKILHLGSFAEDVRLVWANCKLFNDDGSGITRAADHLSEGFEKLYQHVLNFVERTSFGPKSSSQPKREEKKLTSQPKPAEARAEANTVVSKVGLSSKPPATKTVEQAKDSSTKGTTSTTKAVDQANDSSSKAAASTTKAPEQTKDSSSKGVTSTTASPPAPKAAVNPTPTRPAPGVGTSSTEAKPVAKEGAPKDSATASTGPSAQVQDKQEAPAAKATNSDTPATTKPTKPTSTPSVPRSTSPTSTASGGSVTPSPTDSTTTTFVETTVTTKTISKPLPAVDGGANAADPVKAPSSAADKDKPVTAPSSEEQVPSAPTTKPAEEAVKQSVV